jgi:hypothetical protein
MIILAAYQGPCQLPSLALQRPQFLKDTHSSPPLYCKPRNCALGASSCLCHLNEGLQVRLPDIFAIK